MEAEDGGDRTDGSVQAKHEENPREKRCGESEGATESLINIILAVTLKMKRENIPIHR
jgi:hypothetical protein